MSTMWYVAMYLTAHVFQTIILNISTYLPIIVAVLFLICMKCIKKFQFNL